MGIIQKAIVKVCAPKETPDSLSAIIKLNAEKYSLDPKLIACIIYQESGGEKESYRHEKNFYDENLDHREREDLVGFVPNFPPSLYSEKRERAKSHGAMQVLGETARLMGYKGRWLPEIREHATNVDLGCKYLRHLFNKAANIKDEKAKLFQVLKWWNGSADYPPIIFEHMRKEKWRAILL